MKFFPKTQEKNSKLKGKKSTYRRKIGENENIYEHFLCKFMQKCGKLIGF